MNKIDSYTAGTITTKKVLKNTYATGAQVVVLKQYSSALIDTGVTLTQKAWNGTVGGITGWFCKGTTTITGNLIATGKGFRGGVVNGGTHTGEGDIGVQVANQASANGNGGGGGNSASGGGGGNGTAGQTIMSDGGIQVANVALTVLDLGGGGGSGNAGAGNGTGSPGGGGVFIFSKTFIITGGVTINGSDGGSGGAGRGGGGGAGGSCVLKGQILTLGSNLITAAAGAGGSGTEATGGAGGVGRIHADYSSSLTGTTTPTLDSTLDTTIKASLSPIQFFV